jgi:hypothetical protein
MDLTECVCANCGRVVARNSRLPAGCQQYCGRDSCQRARRAVWKRRKIHEDPDYRRNHNDGNRAWRKAHPDYSRNYRTSHPDVVLRNKAMQRVRRRRSPSNGAPVWVGENGGVAKVDAFEPIQLPMATDLTGNLRGDFWLVPRVAKVNALLVRIVVISSDYARCKEPLDGQPIGERLDSASMPTASTE